MTVGENIRRLRKEQGLTQKQLGKLCGINEANIRKYELGGANPKIETLHKIANALNKSIILLIEGCDDKYPLTPNDLQIDLFNSMTDEEKQLQSYYKNMYITQQHEFDLLNQFRRLNMPGELKALEQIELLTKIPEYQKHPSNIKAQPTLNAAHAVPEASEEDIKHDEDIMNDDSQWT